MMHQRITQLILSGLILTGVSVYSDTVRDQSLTRAFTEYRDLTASFLHNVLPVVSFDEIPFEMYKAQYQNDSLYNLVRDTIPPVNQVRFLYRKMAMLSHQRSVLSNQVKRILDYLGIDKINGYVEIGTPGTYIRSINAQVPIQGPIYAVGDTQDRMLSLSPNISRSFQAYDQFVTISDFDPIPSQDIPDQQIDLVTCFPGIHHVPADKLDALVASISRIIRPGGILIIREHDITDTSITTMAHVAHELFNACISQMDEEDNNKEYRNFQTVAYWKEVLRRHGLEPCEDIMLTQEGDPTANTLFACIKQPCNADEAAQLLHTRHYEEPTQEIDTYLSMPEWFNVDASRAYGEYIHHTPFYEFPYMRSVSTYWKILYNSIGTAYQKDGVSAILKSPYFAVSTFIGAFMTIEYGAKACISWPLSKLYGVYMEPQPLYISIQGEVPADIQKAYQMQHVEDATPFETSVYKTPVRYTQFMDLMKHLARCENVHLVRINGHHTIQCKVKSDNIDLYQMPIGDAEILYDWQLPTQEEYRYYAVAVPAHQLLTFLSTVEQNNIHVEYIHDF